MLKLLQFIHENSDWEERLSNPPYLINMNRLDGLIIFSYKPDADYEIDVVRECRGIILDETDGYKPVCVPFFKFANYGEPYADEIDWNTAKVQEKIDGSLIKVWHHKGEWRVSTNKTINAETSRTNSNEDTFLNIFNKAWAQTGKSFCELNPDFTYVFELVSPQTRIVVPYTETKLYHTGTRDNISLEELNADIGIEKPKEFSISTIEDCIEAANNLDKYHEGFVVVDGSWRRVKVKSPIYLALHHFLNNIASDKRILELLISGEYKEVISYFPEYIKLFEAMNERIELFISHNEQELKRIGNAGYISRKEFAEIVSKTVCPACIFFVTDGKSQSVRDFVKSMSAKKLFMYIDKFNPNTEKENGVIIPAIANGENL